jgi:hypothetical protein
MALDRLLVSLLLPVSVARTAGLSTGVKVWTGTAPLASAADGEGLRSTVDSWTVLTLACILAAGGVSPQGMRVGETSFWWWLLG